MDGAEQTKCTVTMLFERLNVCWQMVINKAVLGRGGLMCCLTIKLSIILVSVATWTIFYLNAPLNYLVKLRQKSTTVANHHL